MKIFIILMVLAWSQLSQAQSTCAPYSTIILTDQLQVVGNAQVANDETNLYVSLNSDSSGGWEMYATGVYVGAGPIPQQNGFPVAANFPILENHPNGIASRQYTIPLADLGLACNSGSIQVAIYTGMYKKDSNGNIIQLENAWAFGQNTFPATNVSWWFEYTPCCEVVGGTGCTHSQGYYKTHSAYTKKTPQPWPLSEGTVLCGKTWFDIMKVTPKSGDAWTILAQQYIAAMLNVTAGASTGAIVDLALSDSQSMLANNCSALPKGEAERQLALEYKLLLENYNKGVTGPGMCVE